jgi:ADP-heptose:LPS heptosyltransferase
MKLPVDFSNKTFLISRTDSIGDVMLTLPLCVWIKRTFPFSKVIFLGSTYTLPVLECLPEIDEVWEFQSLQNRPTAELNRFIQDAKIDICIHVFPKKEIAFWMKKAKIPFRIGTSHRVFHFLTCNIRPNFTRKGSSLHESQLNFELLRSIGLQQLPTLVELSSYLSSFKVPLIDLPETLNHFIESSEKIVLLHPKSQGSALEWGIENYIELSNQLLSEGYSVIFTGTEKEGVQFRHLIPVHSRCYDSTGKLSLSQLIVLINKSHFLVACSTGPLHIAGVLGIRAVGLFSPRKPIHPGRWQPLGSNVKVLVKDEKCPVCAAKKVCSCIESISVSSVFSALTND